MNYFFKIILLSACLWSTTTQATDKPNIILVLVDDMGWRDVGFMGNTFVETPTLDKLAHEGLVFTNAYSNAPNCAPSRAAIMSGQYAPRTDVYTMIKGDMGDARLRRVLTPENKMYLEPAVITIAEMLRSAGYQTAHIGKWNLGSGAVRGPLGQGFDMNVAGERNGTPPNGYFAPYDLPGLENAPKGEYLTDRLSQEAVNYIKQSNESKPFFIYLAHFAPHFPFQAPETLVEKYKHKKSTMMPNAQSQDETYAAMVDSIDQGMEKIIRALKEKKRDQNTLIIFTSDNGGYEPLSYMHPLRGEKSLLYEGGIRVPLMLWWPGHISLHTSDEPVIGIDLFPTLMKAAGVASVNQPLDGNDLSPLFVRQNALTRDALYWYFPGYVAGNNEKAADEIFQQRPAAVIREGDWKFIQYLDSNKTELYNLKTDPSESINLASQQLEKQQALAKQLNDWLVKMKTPLPLAVNPQYDAAYEEQYKQSWIRKWRVKLSHTRFGELFRENDL